MSYLNLTQHTRVAGEIEEDYVGDLPAFCAATNAYTFWSAATRRRFHFPSKPFISTGDRLLPNLNVHEAGEASAEVLEQDKARVRLDV